MEVDIWYVHICTWNKLLQVGNTTTHTSASQDGKILPFQETQQKFKKPQVNKAMSASHIIYDLPKVGKTLVFVE